MKQRNEETIGLVMVTAVMVYWGFTTILQKHALLYMASTTYIMLRFLIAALLILPVYWNQLRKSATKSTIRHGCILGFLQLIPMEASVLALKYTTAANSVFISQLSFIFVPLIQCLLHQKYPDRKLLITIAALLMGLSIFADVWNTGIGPGDLYCILSALFTSLHILCTKHFSRTDSGELLGVFQVFFCALFSIPVWLAAPGTVQWCAGSISNLFFTGVIGTAVCFVAHVAGQARISPTKSSFLGLLQPIFAMVGGAVIVDELGHLEPITANMLIGSAVILVALILFLAPEGGLSTFFKRAKKHPEDTAP